MKKIFAIAMAALSVMAISCNKNTMSDDQAYEEFAKDYESVQIAFTQVGNVTIWNEDYMDPKYDDAIMEISPVFYGIQSEIENLSNWAEDCYQRGCLAAELDSLLNAIHGPKGIEEQLTSWLNLFNETVNAIN